MSPDEIAEWMRQEMRGNSPPKERVKRVNRWNRLISRSGRALRVTLPQAASRALGLYESCPVLLWLDGDTFHMMRIDKAVEKYKDTNNGPLQPPKEGVRNKIKILGIRSQGEVPHNE